MKDILTYPKPVIRKKQKAGTSDFPAHLSSEQMIKYLQEKEEKKQAAEEEKKKRKEEREMKKQQREAQKQQKEKKKAKKTQRRDVQQTSRRQTRAIECRTSPVQEEDEDVICPVCQSDCECTDGWVCCDVCDTWYHKECTDIPT